MSAILEEALEEVRTLPLEERQHLRELSGDFSELLAKAGIRDLLIMAIIFALFGKSLEGSDLDELGMRLEELSREMPQGDAAMQSQRAIRANQIRGKYRDVLSSSEEFIARKAAETAKEDRPR
jgi:HEPN domain-containing protein